MYGYGFFALGFLVLVVFVLWVNLQTRTLLLKTLLSGLKEGQEKMLPKAVEQNQNMVLGIQYLTI